MGCFTLCNQGGQLLTSRGESGPSSHSRGSFQEGEDLGFLVLDSAGKYQRMSGEIIAPNQGRISHPGVKTPKSIRYAWEGFPNANLFGEGKMPAFPFRTDQFHTNSEH